MLDLVRDLNTANVFPAVRSWGFSSQTIPLGIKPNI